MSEGGAYGEDKQPEFRTGLKSVPGQAHGQQPDKPAGLSPQSDKPQDQNKQKGCKKDNAHPVVRMFKAVNPKLWSK